jgi:CDP-paratose 2-epimerase
MSTANPNPLPDPRATTLITGGAGFIGTNMADRLASAGARVILFDNLSRDGVERNLRWLLERHGSQIEFMGGDIRDRSSVAAAVRRAERVFHFAAQVAVTTSLTDPLEDFDINARGTLNLLEAIRKTERCIPLLFTSTNKVYGDLQDVELQEQKTRYAPPAASMVVSGIDETRPTHFHSPYGCSKGAADQYVLDYAHTFSMPATVFRMSCIYGPHQFGTEDQGWVAHFLIRTLRGEAITLYGDGKQVRDILFVDDLMDAMLRAQAHINVTSGHCYNIGGGADNTVSLLELTELIARISSRQPEVAFAPWRLADQRFYVSDIGRFQAATGWQPRTGVREGVTRLFNWLAEHQQLPARAESGRNGKRARRLATPLNGRVSA